MAKVPVHTMIGGAMQAWDIKTQLKAEIRQDLLDSEMRIKCVSQLQCAGCPSYTVNLSICTTYFVDVLCCAGTRFVACDSAENKGVSTHWHDLAVHHFALISSWPSADLEFHAHRCRAC